MENNTTSTVSVMPGVDIAEHLPNDDDHSFASDPNSALHVSQQQVPGVTTTDLVVTHSLLNHEQFSTEAVTLKNNHIIIHDQSGLIDTSGLKTPQTPLTPATPSTPGSAGIIDPKTGFRYSWDPSVHDSVLPVRCKNVAGQLYKSKFGSGGRGKCIKVNNHWYTPSEFEAVGGRASSKDWKRSIRYGGRPIQCLIEEGILQPHATCCTCAACCDSTAESGPVRLFVPYKRRKVKEPEGCSSERRFLQNEASKSPPSPQLKDYVVTLTPTPTSLSAAPSFTVATAANSETIQVIAPDVTEEAATAEILTPVSQPAKSAADVDFVEQKQWWQLEEMINTLINCGQQLKHLLEQTKAQSMASREIALHQLRAQLEAEKKMAVQAVKQEAQSNLQRILLEKSANKNPTLHEALQQALVEIDRESSHADGSESTSKHCANCNREAFAECAGCHKVSYCSQFCQRKDWTSHMDDCQRGDIVLIQSTNSDVT